MLLDGVLLPRSRGFGKRIGSGIRKQGGIGCADQKPAARASIGGWLRGLAAAEDSLTGPFYKKYRPFPLNPQTHPGKSGLSRRGVRGAADQLMGEQVVDRIRRFAAFLVADFP